MDFDHVHDPFSFAQIVGYIATIFGVIAMQQRSDNRMRLFVCCMSVFIVTHFLLIGAFSAALAAALAATRWILSMFAKVKKYRRFLVLFYIVVFAISAYMTADHWYHYLPAIASMGGSYALFYCEKLRLRLFLMFGGALWMIHNYMTLSYGPFVMEGFIAISNAIMIYRFIVERKKLPRDPKDSFLTRFG